MSQYIFTMDKVGKVVPPKKHILKDISLSFFPGAKIGVLGLNGSGKSTLVQDILYPALLQKINDDYGKKPGAHQALEGALGDIDEIEMIDQNPIGRSSRSNPVTYIKAYDAIRALMTNQQLSKIRGYKPKHFSFNVEGGRCENCRGEGWVKVEMHFLPDMYVECDVCKGKRFRDDTLEIKFKDKNADN